MERRKIYIITIIIILTLLAGLAVWYAYIVKQETKLTQTQDINTPKTLSVPPIIDSVPTDPGAITTYGERYNNSTDTESEQDSTVDIADTNTIIQPDKWVLTNIYTDQALNINITDTDIVYADAKTGKINSYNTSTQDADVLSIDLLPDTRGVYTLENNYILIIPKNDRAYITKIILDDDTPTLSGNNIIIYDTILQVVRSDSRLYYTTPSGSGISIKYIKYSDLTKDKLPIRELWSSPLSYWTLGVYDSGVYITQMASNNIPGYAYKISNNGTLTAIIRDKPGVITNLSPNGDVLLYSLTENDGVSLYIKDLITSEITPIYTKTLANKCQWGSDSIYIYCGMPSNLSFVKDLPDSWYKGLSGFSDSLWRINTKSGEASELISYLGLDIVDIHILDDVVVFKNKADQSIWSIMKVKNTE
jgi:hypothetical protein